MIHIAFIFTKPFKFMNKQQNASKWAKRIPLKLKVSMKEIPFQIEKKLLDGCHSGFHQDFQTPPASYLNILILSLTFDLVLLFIFLGHQSSDSALFSFT